MDPTIVMLIPEPKMLQMLLQIETIMELLLLLLCKIMLLEQIETQIHHSVNLTLTQMH